MTLPSLLSFLGWGLVGRECQEVYRRSQQLVITWRTVRSCSSCSTAPGRLKQSRCPRQCLIIYGACAPLKAGHLPSLPPPACRPHP